MSKVIWKYPIGVAITHMMPEDAKFLSVQMQGIEPEMWFEVDLNKPLVPRKFRIIGTGQPYEPMSYLGTFQDHSFVWHLFEDNL